MVGENWVFSEGDGCFLKEKRNFVEFRFCELRLYFNSFTGIDHESTGNLAVPQEIVNFGQLAQPGEREGSIDETAAEEIDGFARVLAVPDSAALDGPHVDHDWKNGYTFAYMSER